MPLRQFAIGTVGEEVYPRFVAELAERLDDPALDRNLVVRDTLSQLYLGRSYDEGVLTDDAFEKLIKLAKGKSVFVVGPGLQLHKTLKDGLIRFFTFDHSPVGRNVRLGTQVRAMLAPRVFRRCGRNVRIFHDVEFSFGYNLSVGDGVTIHRNVLIDDRGEVVIGDEASISDYANIYSHSHAVDDIQNITLARTVIGNRARITYHAVLLSGVTIEDDAMVGSMGLASKSVPAGVIAAGIPARPIGQKKVHTSGR